MPFVLDEQALDTGVVRGRTSAEQWRIAFRMTDDRIVARIENDITKAPDTGPIEGIVTETDIPCAIVKIGLEIRAGYRGFVLDAQQPTAIRAAGLVCV